MRLGKRRKQQRRSITRPSARRRQEHCQRRLNVESLESRRLLAVCDVGVDGGDLTLTCDDSPNHVIIEQGSTADEFVLSTPAAIGGESTIVGEGAPDANFLPFSGRSSTRYQQVYSAAEFPGPQTIAGLKLFHHPLGSLGTLASGTLNFELSVTTQQVDGLDTVNLDNNVTGDVLGTGTLVLTGGDGHDLIIGVTPFTYNPALGNLLMDIKFPGGTTRGPGIPAFFESFDPDDGVSAGGIFSRAYDGGGGGFEGWGLKTEFLASVSSTDFGAGPGVAVTVAGVTGDISVDFGADADILQVGGVNNSISLPGGLIVDGGEGNNDITVGGDAGQDGLSVVEIAGDVEVTGGDGNNRTTIGGRDAYNEEYYGETVVRIAGDVEIDNGDGDNRTIIAGRAWNYGASTLEIGGDVEISNGDGDNSTRIGDDVDYGEGIVDIDGDVSIRNGDGVNNTRIGGSGGYGGPTLPASSQVMINGDLEVVNGHGGSATQVGAHGGYYGSLVAISGDVDIRNGNAADSTTIGGNGGYWGSDVLIEGDVRIKNRGGDDVTSVGNYGGYDGFSGVDILGDLEIKNGDGNDQTRIGGDGGYYGTSDLHIAGDVELRNGRGNDFTRFGGDAGEYEGNSIVEILGDVKVAEGDGNDKTKIGGKNRRDGTSSIHFFGNLTINGGEGNDKAIIRARRGATVTVDGDLKIRGGEGKDKVRLEGISVAGKTNIKTHSGKDLIRIKDSIFAGLVKIDCGGDLDDLFSDEGGNTFDGGLIVKGC